MIGWSETPDSFTFQYDRRVDELATPCGVSMVKFTFRYPSTADIDFTANPNVAMR